MFEYYANNQWDFDNANVLYLRTIVNDIEKEKYAIQDDGELMALSYGITFWKGYQNPSYLLCSYLAAFRI